MISHVVRNYPWCGDLTQYIIRNPFSLDKLSYNQETGMVVYKSKRTHGKNKWEYYRVFSNDFGWECGVLWLLLSSVTSVMVGEE